MNTAAFYNCISQRTNPRFFHPHTRANSHSHVRRCFSCLVRPPPPRRSAKVRPAASATTRPLGYSTGGGAGLEPHPLGLALLRSPALRDTPVRTVAIVGQARTGKSFFLNAVAGGLCDGGSCFEVNATTEGLTKGIWLHHLRASSGEAAGVSGTCDTSTSGAAVGACSSGGERSSSGGRADGGGGIATLLLDSEGLGAPGGDLRVYDSKLVALAAMLSSRLLYNAMRAVNQVHFS